MPETWENHPWDIQPSPAARRGQDKGTGRTGRKPQTWSRAVMEAQEAITNSPPVRAFLYDLIPRKTLLGKLISLFFWPQALFRVQEKTSSAWCSGRLGNPAWPGSSQKLLSPGAWYLMFSKASISLFLLGKLKQKAQSWDHHAPIKLPTTSNSSRNKILPVHSQWTPCKTNSAIIRASNRKMLEVSKLRQDLFTCWQKRDTQREWQVLGFSARLLRPRRETQLF